MNQARLRILAVEDDVADGRLLRYAMQGEVDFHAQVTIVRDLTTAIRTLGQWSFDLILLDLNLPDCSGLTTLHRLRAAAPEQAIVIITGTDDVDLATEGLKAGALDFIVKGQMSGHFLVRALQYALERHRLEREVRASQRRALRVNDEILAALADQFQTPFAVLSQFVALLGDERTGALNDAQRDHLDVVARNVERVQRLAKDMLVPTWTSSAPIPLRRQPLDVASIVQEVMAESLPTATRRGVELEVDITGPRLVLAADRVRLRQAVTTLIRQAIEHGSTPGRVGVRVVSDAEARSLRVRVTDVVPRTGSGAGFDALLERVAQETSALAAMGFADARRIVEGHGGSISTAEDAAGPVIEVELPATGLRGLVLPVARGLDRDGDVYTIGRFVIRGSGVSAASDRRQDELHFAVHRTILPDVDVILPLRVEDEHAVHLTVLMRADADSAETLAERIRLELLEEIHAEKGTVEFSLEAIHWSDAGEGESFEARLDGLEARLAADIAWNPIADD